MTYCSLFVEDNGLGENVRNILNFQDVLFDSFEDDKDEDAILFRLSLVLGISFDNVKARFITLNIVVYGNGTKSHALCKDFILC